MVCSDRISVPTQGSSYKYVKPSIIIASSLWTQEIAVKVLNLIRHPPKDNPYQPFKDRLLRMFTLNNFACTEAFGNIPLTDSMQPSTLMSRMLRLLPAGHNPCFFLQAAFLKCLPADVRAHLVHNRILDPLTLALRSSRAVYHLPPQ